MPARGKAVRVSVALIVDDNKMNRTLACDVLRAAGFRTLEAGTAAEGIALAIEHVLSPEVVEAASEALAAADAAAEVAAEPAGA